MNYPGMSGKVKNNWMKRLGPELINTAVGAGFIAWTATHNGSDVRIDTRDAIAGPIIQQSVSGTQTEVSRMGGDVPNTVIIPSGTQFDFLLSEKLEIGL
jgi:type IV secretory pathway VirB10-like protein